MNEWIKCSEDNLPEKEVLCINYQKDYLIGYVCKTEYGFQSENDSEILPKVTHWMPLPKSPET